MLKNPMVTGYAPVENGKLYYEIEGSGPAIVMIHAGFLDSRMWDEQFRLFTKNYGVIRYDVRGFGKSDIAKTKFSDARDLHDLLKHLRIEKTSVLGVSNGGRIAFDFAVEYPKMLQSLMLVAPGIRGYKFSGPEEEKLWKEFEESMKAQEVADREGRARDAVEMDVNAWASAQSPESRRRVFEIALDNFHAQRENPWKLQVSPDPPGFMRLSSIRAPTLFIVGDRDVAAQVMMVENIHAHMPGSKKILIRGADHIANMSKPNEFNNAILEFLNAQRPSIVTS